MFHSKYFDHAKYYSYFFQSRVLDLENNVDSALLFQLLLSNVCIKSRAFQSVMP